MPTASPLAPKKHQAANKLFFGFFAKVHSGLYDIVTPLV
jgi:hypothetical protein